ncbi:MAG: hypothetical protein P1U36_02045 [Legionellaceae bacterium]|nr:hypothetical protein [Legionellaceae bacterium]
MDNKKKQELLTKEFVLVLRKSQDICEKFLKEYRAHTTTTSSYHPIAQVVSLTDGLLENLKVIDGCFSSEYSTNEEKMKSFQAFQSSLESNFICTDISADMTELGSEYQGEDVVSTNVSALERIQMDFINVLRGLCERFGKIFTFMTLEKDKANLGETRFSLRATGQSQFLPRPMKSLNDAKEALEDISTRLNECIKLKNQDDKKEEDDILDLTRI